jgi:hypothetical protein
MWMDGQLTKGNSHRFQRGGQGGRAVPDGDCAEPERDFWEMSKTIQWEFSVAQGVRYACHFCQ